jgi:uncharacterized protein (TIGR02271 family)
MGKGDIAPPAGAPRGPEAADEGLTLRLVAEELHVDKATRETGRVRVAVRTLEREAVVDEDLARQQVTVETVPIGRQVDAMPPVRQEGDTTIVPIVEEVLVVERRLLLKEELRITRVRTVDHHHESVTLRHQEVAITRHKTDPDQS